jgi:hypothetical protein
MDAAQMREIMNRTPFQPFEIHLSDGASLRVDNPYDIAVRPESADCLVFEENRWRFVAYRNITEVITGPMNGA